MKRASFFFGSLISVNSIYVFGFQNRTTTVSLHGVGDLNKFIGNMHIFNPMMTSSGDFFPYVLATKMHNSKKLNLMQSISKIKAKRLVRKDLVLCRFYEDEKFNCGWILRTLYHNNFCDIPRVLWVEGITKENTFVRHRLYKHYSLIDQEEAFFIKSECKIANLPKEKFKHSLDGRSLYEYCKKDNFNIFADSWGIFTISKEFNMYGFLKPENGVEYKLTFERRIRPRDFILGIFC